MNTGQMILAIGAMILLSTIVMRVNSTFMASDEVLDQSKYIFLATSIATSVIQEARNLKFDKITTDSTIGEIKNKDLFSTIGYDDGEIPDSAYTFDDFDDYNGWHDTVKTLPSAVFNVTCRVVYVNENNPTIPASGKTFNKMITVTITSDYMRDVIQLSSIFSYWFLR
jgi:MSHA pilin protein MshD